MSADVILCHGRSAQDLLKICSRSAQDQLKIYCLISPLNYDNMALSEDTSHNAIDVALKHKFS